MWPGAPGSLVGTYVRRPPEEAARARSCPCHSHLRTGLLVACGEDGIGPPGARNDDRTGNRSCGEVSTSLAGVAFVIGAAVSLATSWVLVSRLERLGARLGFSEALLGVVAALAADAPEITSAVSALLHGQAVVGAGVVIGSNVFNLAALLGLGAVVAGTVALHHRAVVLQGAIALWVAAACLLVMVGVLPAAGGLAVVAVVLVPYLVVSAADRARWWTRQDCGRVQRWLQAAISEEEAELEEAVAPAVGRGVDGLVAVGALVVVVAASVVMERAGTTVGAREHLAPIVVGGVGLAAVTSLPNAVAAIYLARRGRGAAAMSTAFNSNALNVVAGLLVPGAVLGMGTRSPGELLVAGWYLGLTAVVVVLAVRHTGLHRSGGWVVVLAYLVFLAALVSSQVVPSAIVPVAVAPSVVVAGLTGVVVRRPSAS